MKISCESCGGQGRIGHGRLGSCEAVSHEECSACDGSGLAPLLCELCGDHEATSDTWISGLAEPRTASLLRVCDECYAGTDEVLTWTTRPLPALSDDAAAEVRDQRDRLRGRVSELQTLLQETARAGIIATHGRAGNA